MSKMANYKFDKSILILLLIFCFISIITIYSSQSILDNSVENLANKQFIWYLIGFGFIFLITIVGNVKIFKYSFILYLIGNITLFLLLIFGTPINNARCWFSIPGGTIQPSEFMKLILIIVVAKLIQNFNDQHPYPSLLDEFLFLLKVGFVILIPSVLTFLEPDTGVVLIYVLITSIMLFISGIRYRFFIILSFLIMLIVGCVLFIYFNNQNLFVNLFGSSFFLRVDRILDWSNKSGFQLENGLSAIGSSGLFGYGISNTPIYFPEAQTDFIFAVFASNFGFLGSILLLFIILFFDMKLIITAIDSNNNINKYIISGVIGMLLFQQFQNISMTLGLVPITGITLPFISYGGSSLLSYMLAMGLIFNISNQNLKN
ncbi:MAG: FtsW/RodA/SpoVE family cell cycle protein [Bacilli bacterium]